MHHHLGLQIGGAPNAPPTPPSTQGATASRSNSNTQPSATRPPPSDVRNPSAPIPCLHSGPSQPSSLQTSQSTAAQPANRPAAPISVPVPGQPVPPPAPQPQEQSIIAAAPALADEIAALRARIAELEHGSAHGIHIPARAPAPQQALIADPAAVDCIRANLASSKEESKKLTLPALQPGHKHLLLVLFSPSVFPLTADRQPPLYTVPLTSRSLTAVRQLSSHAIVASIPPNVEEAFKQYRYIPYTALTHAARSKAHLRGEDSTFVFTQDRLTAKALIA
ncbi:uncharacterized protein EDB91DRAFT_1250512 [Suillus paluster]|uniref:uncharacterized protein n=1 Tax=Suillus paluster TaxID=48578 RepID=UPI001B8613C7|nr:uncharacterized protein EDB91DRAFT_1250512 [Suillus paluster]KAG1735301.1 hypothetical protein EDB91DRAFT_1250512 [Suillus paluster]